MVATIATRTRERARSSPKRVALREKALGIWQETTWAEYGDLVERVAHGLVALGVRPGDHLAIESANRPEWLVAEAGAVAARAVVAEVGAGTRVLIAEDRQQVDSALAAKAHLPELEWIVYIEPRAAREHAEPSVFWWRDLLARGAEHRSERPRLLDQLTAEIGEDDLVSSSLTAGQVNRVLATPPHPDPGPGDFVLCHLPLSEVASRRSTAWLSADAGVQLHFADRSGGLVQTLNEVEPSLFLGTPATWEELRILAAKRKRTGLRRCRSAVSTSPISPELAAWSRRCGIEVGVA